MWTRMKINKNEKIVVICESPNKVKTISSILKNAGYTKEKMSFSSISVC